MLKKNLFIMTFPSGVNTDTCQPCVCTHTYHTHAHKQPHRTCRKRGWTPSYEEQMPHKRTPADGRVCPAPFVSYSISGIKGRRRPDPLHRRVCLNWKRHNEAHAGSRRAGPRGRKGNRGREEGFTDSRTIQPLGYALSGDPNASPAPPEDTGATTGRSFIQKYDPV